jgi:hypothetical protein
MPRLFLMFLSLIMVPGCSEDSGGGDVGVDVGVDTARTCDPQSCSQGCCTADKECVTSPTNTQCGRSGGLCIDCTQGGGTCTVKGNGAYCELPAACSAASCPSGCCEKQLCWTGASDLVCGAGGAPCVDCTVGGQTCVAQACTGTVTCDAQSCATGCCRAGKCLEGTSDFACGTGGAVCLDCTGSGQSCGAQKTCN